MIGDDRFEENFYIDVETSVSVGQIASSLSALPILFFVSARILVLIHNDADNFVLARNDSPKDISRRAAAHRRQSRAHKKLISNRFVSTRRGHETKKMPIRV